MAKQKTSSGSVPLSIGHHRLFKNKRSTQPKLTVQDVVLLKNAARHLSRGAVQASTLKGSKQDDLPFKIRRGGRLYLLNSTHVINERGEREKTQTASKHKVDRSALFTAGEPLNGGHLEEALSLLANHSADVFGSKPKAMAWLSQHPIPALGGETSRELIKSGRGLAVVNYLDEIRYGSRG